MATTVGDARVDESGPRYRQYWEEMPCYLSVHDREFRIIDGNRLFREDFGDRIGRVKKLQNLLQQSQERLQLLFEEVPCFITVQGPDRVIRHANRRFEETFGPAVGENCFRVYKHREEQCLVCPMQQTFADGEVRRHEEVIVSRAGEKLNVLCTTAPMRNAAGEVEGVIEMCIDITEMRQLQSQLTSIGLLVGSISHGIKGLLTGLDGGIYMVNSGFAKDNPDRVKKGWDMVQRNVDRIRSMVLDILYYAKDRELTPTEVDPVGLVEEIREGLEKKSSDLDVRLDIDIATNVGVFSADLHAIRAMLVNLLENSLDACRVDSEKKDHYIRLSVRRAEPWMVFEVKDNGIGMDRETREKLFSLFFSSKGIKGTGLGLFISNKIVDKHGGTVTVESEPNRGTRFLVRLPIDAKPSVQPREAAAS